MPCLRIFAPSLDFWSWGAVTSVGSRGDSYVNALAESVIGLYKAELVRRRGPWRGVEDLEYATLERIDWYNNRRALQYDRLRLAGRARGRLVQFRGPGAGRDSNNRVSMKAGAVHLAEALGKRGGVACPSRRGGCRVSICGSPPMFGYASQKAASVPISDRGVPS